MWTLDSRWFDVAAFSTLWAVLMVPFVIRHLSNVFGGGH